MNDLEAAEMAERRELRACRRQVRDAADNAAWSRFGLTLGLVAICCIPVAVVILALFGL